MDIRPSDPNPIRPGQSPDAKPAESKPVEGPGFGEKLDPASAAGGATPARPTEASLATAYNRMAPIIKRGVEQKLSRGEILSQVVEDQAKQQFGKLATAGMTRSIAEKFQSDPQLSSIFNQLYDYAARQ